MHLESIAIIGYLGQDPRSNNVAGKTVCNFNVGASNPRTKKTNWYRIAVWGAQAEPCMKFLQKGSAVYIEGSFDIKDWQKDGTSDKQFEINARNIQFLSMEKKEKTASPTAAIPQSESGYGTQSEPDFDSIPF
jgi:single-strand DNA-binding protein